MKKIIAISSTVVLAAILSFSVMSFRDGDPKKQKTETASSKECDKQKEGAACQKSDNSAGCDKQADKSSADCSKSCDKTADKK